MKRKICDAHLHLDSRIEGPVSNAVRSLDRELAESGIEKGIVLHLNVQPWPVEEVAAALAESQRLSGLVNVHPMATDAVAQLQRGINDLGFIGLKLHPRLDQYSITEPEVAKLINAAGEMGVPVLIDAFPDGDWLMQGFDPLKFASVAKASPDTKIVIAHFGGHHCIDMMMLAKRLPNIYFDLSYSFLYYRGSRVVEDLLYCCKSMRYNRVMYGSDYPDRSIKVSIEDSLIEFDKQEIDEIDLNKILYLNAADLFAWPQK
jgi:predicted TIM-barrel fold metal-dependent hydrolase